MGESSGRRRIASLDTARGLAILLAIATHLSQGSAMLADASNLTRAAASLFFQTATPTFLFLFGVMIELVYVRRAADPARRPGVRRRLLVRSFQCYLGIVVATSVAWLVGGVDFGQAFRSLLMLEVPVAFSSVLRYYMFAILLSVLYVEARQRVGGWLPLALLAAVWAPDLFLGAPPVVDGVRGVDQLVAFLLGRPAGPDLFCLPYSSTLPLLGMLGGRALVKWQDTELPRDLVLAAAMIAGGALCVAVALVGASPREVLEDYVWLRYRIAFHPLYFAIGMLCGGLLIVLCSLVVDRFAAFGRLRSALRFVGTSSLSAFAVGNSVAVTIRAQRELDYAPPGLLFLAGMVLFALIIAVLPDLRERARIGMRRLLTV